MKSNTPFSAGCDLWILLNQPDSYWWKEIDFQSAFLLSNLNKHTENPFTRSISSEVENILKETDFPKSNFKSESKLIFIATQNHFLNRWICLIDNVTDIQSDEFANNLKNLKCNNIRFFCKLSLTASLKSSFPNAEFISDSQ